MTRLAISYYCDELGSEALVRLIKRSMDRREEIRVHLEGRLPVICIPTPMNGDISPDGSIFWVKAHERYFLSRALTQVDVFVD